MIMPYERGKKESWVKIVKFDTQGTEMAFEEATERYLLAMIPFFEKAEKKTLNFEEAVGKGHG